MNRSDSVPFVLIADDDPDDRMMVQEAFEERCPLCSLCFVQDGEELMTFLQNRASDRMENAGSQLPDLLLLDLNMPLKDGRESLIEIKNNPIYEAMPTVVMTTSESEEDKLFCQETGADAYIVKPSRYTELLEAVESLKVFFTKNPDSW